MEIVWRAWWWSSVEIEAWFLENEKYVQLLCFVKKQFFFFFTKKKKQFFFSVDFLFLFFL
jgi:hypothetical protein